MTDKKTSRIAISSQKGGVSKTTSCLSLGACLVEMGYSVLLVDLDPQAHLTQSLGIQPHRVRRTIGEALLKQATLLSTTRESPIHGLDLIPANSGLVLIDKLLYAVSGYEYRLRECLETLQGGFYDFVLMDCSPTIGPLTLNALTAANLAVVPSTCDYFSAQSLKSFLDFFELVRKKSNPAIHYRILVTMFDRRLRLSRMILDQYQTLYGDFVLTTTISLNSKLRESPLFSSPITQYAKNSRSAEEYRTLAKELIEGGVLNA